MPIRFQVDPDFYDHPKTVGMSDAAVALWTRAGSYSAAKLTDGFIAEHVLALLSQTPQEAADELKRRGLWSRVRGGYQFHEWSERNLTKQRVQDDQKADRERKARERAAARKAGGQNKKPQAEPQNVRPDTDRTPDGIQAESGESPGASVSVSVSESVSGSGRNQSHGHPPIRGEPPTRCPQHLQDPNPPNCGPCADTRRGHEQWQRDQAQTAAHQRQTQARARAQTAALAIANCPLCDTAGYINGRACPHDPTLAARATNGAALARAVLPKNTAETRQLGEHTTTEGANT